MANIEDRIEKYLVESTPEKKFIVVDAYDEDNDVEVFFTSGSDLNKKLSKYFDDDIDIVRNKILLLLSKNKTAYVTVDLGTEEMSSTRIAIVGDNRDKVATETIESAQDV